MKINLFLQLAEEMLCFRPHQGIHRANVLDVESRGNSSAGGTMSIALRKDETIPQTTSQELSSAWRLDKVVAVCVEDIRESPVVGGNHETVVQGLSEMDQSFIWNIPEPVHNDTSSRLTEEDFGSDEGTLVEERRINKTRVWKCQ